jgi:DNA-binding MarR family transcriptional regulator
MTLVNGESFLYGSDLNMKSLPTEGIRTGYLIHRIERLLQREIQMRLSHLGITFSMFHFLRLLLREDGRKHKEITEESGLTPSTTASAMKSLEKEGLISRQRGTLDSREIYVYLTPKALALRGVLDKVSNEVITKAMGNLSPEQVQALQLSLYEVAKALEGSAKE